LFKLKEWIISKGGNMSGINWKQASLAALAILGLTGCENLPGDKGSQGAVIGGVSGAAVGAAVGGEQHRVLGAILGGAIGAGGGYVIGANTDKITGKDRQGAETAARKSQDQPATGQQAMNATTADLNSDGFVTLDEVVAMKQAGFDDAKMLERLRATNHVFDLTEEQKKYLRDHGVSESVVNQMNDINKAGRDRVLSTGDSVISSPAPVTR
jgi:Glycine zipper